MRKSILSILFSITAILANANNVQLTNVSVANNLAGTGKVIQFDLSWENSWRTASTGNLDGIWVFFKFKDNDGKWYPLRFTGTDITMPGGATYDMGNNGATVGIGMFIYRSSLGSGTAIANGIKAGIPSYPGTFEVRGFAIEMVLVPQGSFYVGDGTLGTTYYRDSTAGAPFQVTGIGTTVQIGNTAGKLYDGLLSQPFNGDLGNYATGYNGYWMMKYELSQGAYRDFLNTLTNQQQATRFGISPEAGGGCLTCLNNSSVSQIRGKLKIKTPGNNLTNIPAVVGCDYDNDNIYDEASDAEWSAMSYINWPDAAAYLDWAGLRPMTEMEYEKACRGPLTPVMGEYAWGTDQIATSPYTITNSGSNNESIANASTQAGNAIYQSTTNIIFPQTIIPETVRGGIFASSISTRVSAGAAYYGAMECTGNLFEFAVGTFNAAGRSYNNKHGDGILDDDGNANENAWPGINGNNNGNVNNTIYTGVTGVTGTAGLCTRGGCSGTVNFMEISARSSSIISTSKDDVYGIRGVRLAN